MNSVMRRYTFKLYPTDEQSEIMHCQRMMIADLWNALLQRREDVYRRERRTLTRFDLEYEITALYRECPEWRALSTWSGRRVNVALDLAFQAFFRRLKQGDGAQSGYPRYKRRKDGDRIPHRCASGCKLLPAPRERSNGSENSASARNRNWALTVKGVDGPIHARGKYPNVPIDCKDADIIWRHGEWTFSICVEMEPSRVVGKTPIVVEMDCIDGFVKVNGQTCTPPQFAALQAMQDHVDRLKSERDKRWPRRMPMDAEWRDANDEISRLSAKMACIRGNALHVWSCRIVRDASDLTIIRAPVKDQVKSPRGDEKEWGANVKTVSLLNRNVLNFAPAMAQAMLEYKAKESGIRCDVVEREASDIAIGAKLVAAGKEIRKLRRALRRENYNEHNQQRVGSP